MELDEGDAYAAAALFTLALHQSQVGSLYCGDLDAACSWR